MQDITGYDAILSPGAAAALVGVTPQTLREYEKSGLLSVAKRTPRGQRRYSLAEINRLVKESALVDDTPDIPVDPAVLESFNGEDVPEECDAVPELAELFKDEVSIL